MATQQAGNHPAGGRRASKIARLVCFFIVVWASTQSAAAGFLKEYPIDVFSVLNVDGDGYTTVLNNGTELRLTGPNDGSGNPGSTQFMTTAVADGSVTFGYVYSTADDPGFDSAGYLLAGRFIQLADTSGQSGLVTVPVSRGDSFGFWVWSADNQGEPGILIIGSSIPSTTTSTPEPVTTLPVALAIGAAAVAMARRQSKQS
jgi:hypothetical protein